MSNFATGTIEQGLMDVLHAPGPTPDRAEAMMLYGQFVGSWAGTMRRHIRGGGLQEMLCEAHFGWVLEGRAVQDVWLVPRRPGEDPAMYGTTLRSYDPADDLWRVVWIDPARRKLIELVGDRAGDEIVQDWMDYGEGRRQWLFTEITDRSFLWLDRTRAPRASTWTLRTEIALRRVIDAHGPFRALRRGAGSGDALRHGLGRR
jgi:hypothetical protein